MTGVVNAPAGRHSTNMTENIFIPSVTAGVIVRTGMKRTTPTTKTLTSASVNSLQITARIIYEKDSTRKEWR